MVKKRSRKILKFKLILMAIPIVFFFFFIAMAASVLLFIPGDFKPPPGKIVTEENPEVSFKYSSSPDYLKEVTLDGEDVSKNLSMAGKRLVIKDKNLSEGEHRVEITYQPLLALWPIKRGWTFKIDTSPPIITIYKPEINNLTSSDQDLLISGKTEKNCKLKIIADDRNLDIKINKDGEFEKTFKLNPGKNKFKVISTDTGGNSSTSEINVFFDSSPPELSNPFPPDKKVISEIDPLISVSVAEEGIISQSFMKINGKEVECTSDKGVITYKPEKLAEGTHNIEVEVIDSAGLKDSIKWSFTVDSTELYGQRTQILGATGEDVKDLQKMLQFHGYLEEKDITGTFDKKTLEAVKKFQEKKNLASDGVVGPATVDNMSFYIVVDLDDFTLSLIYDDVLQKNYYIACGSFEYPTPTGEFIVTNKIKDPTWIPPDSPWAKEAEITEPGENNPLGTRWIELNSSLVGIHGTNYPGTIGLNASHGCVRMTIPDVEELYEYVNIGTRVTIKDQIIPPTPTPYPTATPLPKPPSDDDDDENSIVIYDSEEDN